MNAQALGCEAIAKAMATCGVTRVIASPGYRNAPLLYSLERRPEIEVTMVIDERTAGFVALGVARATGQPVVLSCTSGSAAGHYFPALMEAKESGLPLIALTADRPMELQRIGANQTTDQVALFDSVAAYSDSIEFANLEEVETFSGVSSAGTKASQAVFSRVQSVCQNALRSMAPAHINVRLRKPLENDIADVPVAIGPDDFVVSNGLTDPNAKNEIEKFVTGAPKGIIVDGPPFGSSPPNHRESLCLLSRKTGWPILSDILAPTAGAKESLGLRPLWLSTIPSDLQPDKILWFGRAPTSTQFLRWLSAMSTETLHVHRAAHALDTSGLSKRVYGDVDSIPASLLSSSSPGAAPTAARAAWSEGWQNHAKRGLDWHRRQSKTHTWEAGRIQDVLDRWPFRFVHLGNSTVVRDIDDYVRTPPRLRFYGNRGLSGIDGTLATAFGEALAFNEPHLAIVGDVTFAHDIGSLFQIPKGLPLAIAVIDNGGGQIFSSLPVSKLPEFESHYLTPPNLDFRAIANAAGFSYENALPEQIQPRSIYHVKIDYVRANSDRKSSTAGALL